MQEYNIQQPTPSQSQKSLLPLLGLSVEAITEIALSLGLKRFNGKQISQWIYQHHATSIDEMTNLSKQAREKLKTYYCVGSSAPVDAQKSIDGTIKYLFQTQKGQYIETVYIPDGERATLCVSCQVGCKMGCTFCMTGRQGFEDSLSTTDIFNQAFSIPEYDKLTNIVYMGQGEPFDNLDNVLASIEALTAPWGWGWSPKRITVSSCGLKKGLKRFLDESRCNLAISLHHSDPEGRAQLMPAEKAWSIKEIIRTLQPYDFCKKEGDFDEGAKQRRLTFEYIVFKDINDDRKHAQMLVNLLKDLDCRINLIRFHDIPNTPLHGVDNEHMRHFRDFLTHHGLFATIRASRGQDIFAACGLLTTAKLETEKNTLQQGDNI